ncbi:MAG: hypothetical protein ACFE8P_05230, partial [Promethearchaeota archaeon]
SIIGVAVLSGQIAALTNRSRLRRAVKLEFESNPEASIDEISASTSITKKDVQAIILELKMRGELRDKFSTSTGRIKTINVAKIEED